MFDRRAYRLLAAAVLGLVVVGLLLGAAQGALLEARLFFANLAARAPLTQADIARAAYVASGPPALGDSISAALSAPVGGDMRHRPVKEPVPTPPGPTPAAYPVAAYAVTIHNDGPAALCAVHLSPAGSSLWGDDWLEGRGVLAAGSAHSFHVAPGRYDMRVVDCAGLVAGEQRSVDVGGPVEWRVGARR